MELIEQHSDIDVVITDQAMPKMTGLQLSATLAQSRPNLPVIIATGYAELPADEGFNSLMVLNKPLDLEQLDSSLSKVLSGERGRSG